MRRSSAGPAGFGSILLAAVVLLFACGPPLLPPKENTTPEIEASAPAPIVTTERGPRGGHLVFVAEDGARAAELTRSTSVVGQDSSPSFSPDGRWVVFASSRNRQSFAETSLWIVAAHPGATPMRLTDSAGTDRDPVWLDDHVIVFSSSRKSSFDLFRARLTREDGAWALDGEPRRLTTAGIHELAPAVSPDGRHIAYTALDPKTKHLTLWAVPASGGPPRKLTDGPADVAPAFFPDGDRIAFSALAPGRKDTDIYVMRTDGNHRRVLVDEPFGHETGPVISRDGRFVFATSVYRSVETGRPVLSSIVVADLRDSPPVFRALHDPVAVETRIGVALSPAALDASALGKNRIYKDALKHAIRELLRRGEDSARRE